MHPSPRSLLLVALLTACSSESAEETDPPDQRASARDTRYCEVIPLFVDATEVHADVYNTIEFSDCPQAAWEQLDAVAIQEELEASTVMLNGPRYFIMDAAEGDTDPNAPVKTFGSLEMRRLATFTLDLANATDSPYTERTIDRNSEFVFYSGALVFELVSPDGGAYVMQSYAHIVDDTLTLADLPSLGDRLEVPEGWQYRSRTLDADIAIVSIGAAHVVQDELKNTYLLDE